MYCHPDSYTLTLWAEQTTWGAAMKTAWLALAALSCLAQPARGLDLCPKCGDGCVPEQFVEQTRDPESPVFWPCPLGCIPLERVVRLRSVPGCIYVQDDAPLVSGTDTTASRVVMMPTAASNPVGQWTMTGYVAGLWQVEYAVSEHVQVGSMVILPIYVAGAIPNIKFQTQASEHLQLGGGAFVGLGGIYVGGSGGSLLLFGGHLELSVPIACHSLTLGLVGGTGGGWSNNRDFDLTDGAWLFPYFAWQWAFHDDWLFMTELTSVMGVRSDGLWLDEAFFVLIYGIRGHGQVMFGDIGFALPLFSAYIKEMWRYTPLGFPYFSIGLKF